MLFAYMHRAQKLLRDQRCQLINPSDLISYINEARMQLVGESECLPFMGSLALSAGTQVYSFSDITLTGAAAAGIQQPINVSTLWFQVASGQKWLRPRPWPWFSLYELNNPVPSSGPPAVWSQYGQGTAGTIYVSPLPDQDYVVPADCMCLPIELVDDTTVEAIPQLWQEAVPYYATYLAMLSMDTGADVGAADKMLQKYTDYVQRARRAATPSILPTIYSQVQNPVRANQIGEQAGGG